MTDDPTAASAEPPKSRGGAPRRTDWQEPFLERYALLGIETSAAAQSRVSLDTISRERKRNPEFEARFQEAQESANGVLEQFMLDRATRGQPFTRTTTKTFPDGTKEVTVVEDRYISTAALIALCKARMPHKYREHYEHRHVGPGGGPIVHEHDLVRRPTRERMLELTQIARELEMPGRVAELLPGSNGDEPKP